MATREDVREFLGNYRRAGLLNGWDEEKLALGLLLFLKQQACEWFKTLTATNKNESFQVLSQKLISHFESNITLWQLRQKLEERRQLLGETLADYCYDVLSFCSRLNLPKSEWLYCFVRGLRPEIRDHVILQQPTDVDSALNFFSLVMFYLIPVSLLSRQTLKCLNLKLPSHVKMGALKKASLKTSIMKILIVYSPGHRQMKTKMFIRQMFLCFLLKVKTFMRSLQVKIYLEKSV